jgi:hypothetical protein
MSATQQAKPDFTAAMNRLRDIARASTDALLTEGEVNPDHQLLDLCAEALHRLKHAQKARGQRNGLRWRSDTPEEQRRSRAEDAALFAEWQEGEKSAKPAMLRIRKMKATTAAGIYAKAAVVRASETGAAVLAMSLAEDLLACPGLRSALWPAAGDQ